jgi:hypothetical protein
LYKSGYCDCRVCASFAPVFKTTSTPPLEKATLSPDDGVNTIRLHRQVLLTCSLKTTAHGFSLHIAYLITIGRKTLYTLTNTDATSLAETSAPNEGVPVTDITLLKAVTTLDFAQA